MTDKMNNEAICSREAAHTSGFHVKRDVAIVRGEGARLWDADGREYLDCAAGHGVALLGHCHPAVTGAVCEQSTRLITCQESFPNDVRTELQERLIGVMPKGLERLFLCNSGTEAVEAAIKIARLATGRTGVVAAMQGFHGRTLGALSATWKSQYRKPFEPLVPDFSHVPYGDEQALESAVDEGTAAVILEVVQGEGGVRIAPEWYLAAARRICDRNGALLIIDEIQTGLGRTGHWFACLPSGVVPDLLCVGKGLAGGLPMAAVGIGAKIPPLPSGAHGSTFGGNPLCCAAALSVLETLEKEDLIDRSAELGRLMINMFRKMASPMVREVRGMGLMIGVELRIRAAEVLRRLLDAGVIALPAGTTVVRFLPPLIIDESQIEFAVDALAGALDAVAADGKGN